MCTTVYTIRWVGEKPFSIIIVETSAHKTPGRIFCLIWQCFNGKYAGKKIVGNSYKCTVSPAMDWKKPVWSVWFGTGRSFFFFFSPVVRLERVVHVMSLHIERFRMPSITFFHFLGLQALINLNTLLFWFVWSHEHSVFGLE